MLHDMKTYNKIIIFLNQIRFQKKKNIVHLQKMYKKKKENQRFGQYFSYTILLFVPENHFSLYTVSMEKDADSSSKRQRIININLANGFFFVDVIKTSPLSANGRFLFRFFFFLMTYITFSNGYGTASTRARIQSV